MSDTQSIRLSMLILGATLTTGCEVDASNNDLDTGVAGEREIHVAEAQSAARTTGGAPLPTSCQDILDLDPTAADGEYTLYVAGARGRPWTARCDDMAGTPTEYLPLVHVGGRANTSFYPCDGWSYGTDVTTSFTHVRIDPATFEVDPSDLTYATSSGACSSFTALTALNWGFAGSCNGTPSGRANVDLSGTPFVVAPDAFRIDGWMAEGSAVYGAGSRVVRLVGGGACGYMLPTDAVEPGDADARVPLLYRP